MAVVPGTVVTTVFYSYTTPFPPLYYKTGEGTLNLASVNAGNSNGLCVGLGGINAGFYTELAKAGQSSANLDPQPEQGGQKPCSALPTTLDDYQGRHQNLLAKAGTALTAFETYSNTNPSAFSYVNGTKVNAASGWYEGICFADIFDPSLRPGGNSKNLAMLYVAPPYGQNYAQKTDFLAAIQATAFNMIVTIAGYNAVAAQNGQQPIESLRNCLYSSNNYGKAGVTNDEVARAIFAGLAAALQKNPNCGLKELQFPVNPGGNPLFDAVQSDLTQGQPSPGAPNRIPNGGVIEMMADDETSSEDGDSDDDNDDDNDNSIELDNLGQGADPDAEQVDNMPAQNSAQAVDSAAAADNALLKGNKPPQNYGVLPKPRYALAARAQESRLEVGNAIEEVYGRVTAADYNHVWAPAHPNDSQVLSEAKAAREQMQAVKKAADQALSAEDLKSVAASRKAARAAAKAARQAATNARKLAPREDPLSLDDNDEDPAKVEGREFARQAEEFASGAEYIADRVENHVDDLKREAAKLRSPMMRVAAIVILVLSLIGLIGGLIWTFLFGYGRSLGTGAFRFGAKDLSVKAPDTDTKTTVDVLAELAKAEGQAKLEFIQAVHLVDDTGKILATNPAGWSTSGLNIVFTSAAGPRAAVSVKYVLEAVGPIAPAMTDPATVTINFVPVVMDAKNPVDIAVAASDRTSAVSVAVPDGFRLDAMDADGVWSYDAKSGKATYTPNATAKIVEPLKAAAFKLLPDGNSAKVVVLFPPAALTATGNRNMGFTFPAVATTNDGVTASISFGSTGPISATADATTTVDGAPLIVGTWSLAGANNNEIVFAPNTNLTSSVLTLDPVSYTLVHAGTRSAAATATLTLPEALIAPNVTRVTADRSKNVVFAAVGAVLQGTTSDTNGSWSVNATTGNVAFKPATGLAATETTVSVSYYLQDATGQSSPATLSITFLPAPVDLAQQSVSRTANTSTDIGSSVKIASDYSLKLWDGANAVDSLQDTASGGSWTVSGLQIAFMPPTAPVDPAQPLGDKDVVPFTAASAKVSYVFVAKNGTSDKPGTVTLDFDSVTPVAYDFGVTAAVLKPSLSIKLLPHIYAPSGVKAVYFGLATANNTTITVRNSATVVVGTFAVVTTGSDPTISLTPVPTSTETSYSVAYRIVDTNDVVSNISRLKVTLAAMARPQLRNFLLSTDVTAGKSIAADVLTNAESLFPPDRKSIVFTGLSDINGTGLPADAMLKLDGKAVAVPGEGTWMVTDSNKILFQAESGLATPPTPALVQYTDVKGNVSNEATVVIDPSLATLSTLNKTLTTDDTAFWASFQKHVVLASPPLTADEFITTTAALSGAVFAAAGKVGANPVKETDFQTAFDQWVTAGQPWDPADGDGTNDIMTLCAATVSAAMPTNSLPLQQRYWTLDAISRMLARALPDEDDTTAESNP